MGHPKHNRTLFEADEIDRTVIHKISVEEVRRRGLIPIDKTESVLQQIDLPEKLFNVILKATAFTVIERYLKLREERIICCDQTVRRIMREIGLADYMKLTKREKKMFSNTLKCFIIANADMHRLATLTRQYMKRCMK